MLARDLQKRLHCDVLRIEEARKRTGFTILLDLIFKRRPKLKKHNFFLKTYDNIILVAPVWAGKIAMPLRSFLLNERFNIKRYSFITVCGGRQGQKRKLLKELIWLMGKSPAAITELWINDLLPAEKKDTIKYTSGYRLKDSDLEFFNSKIEEFVDVADDVVFHVET